MKKRKLCMIFLLCLALMALVAGCRSKKETNDQGNQKGTAIYYTNNDVTKLIMKKENVELEGNQQQKELLINRFQYIDGMHPLFHAATPDPSCLAAEGREASALLRW